MSEESSITVEQQKEKNPKRVEAGKRLAALNKAAREKKCATHTNTLTVENTPTKTEGIEFAFQPLFIAGVVGISGLVYFYFNRFYKPNKTVVKDTEDNTKQEADAKAEASKTRLRSLD